MDDLFAYGKWALGNLRQAIAGIFTKTNLPLASVCAYCPSKCFSFSFHQLVKPETSHPCPAVQQCTFAVFYQSSV